MEDPPPSKRIAVAGRGNDRESVCDGIEVDGEWQHQRVSEGGGRRRPIRTGILSLQDPDLHFPLIILRFAQLRDVTRGLIYMHDQGIIHGDLKGVRF